MPKRSRKSTRVNRNGFTGMFGAMAIAVGLCLPLQTPLMAQVMAQGLLPGLQRQTVNSEYTLGPGDQIEITVFGYDEYTGTKVILPDGAITLQLIGAIPAVGRTTEQLAQDLTAALDPLLVNPVVTVSLISLRPVVVNVAGEVYRPGPVELRGVANAGGAEGPPSVSSALVEAGGVTQNADIRQVVLRRTFPDGSVIRSTVNLWDVLWSETTPEDLILRDGDVVFVPQLGPDETLDRRLLARSSLSPSTVRVRVVGEVTRPGEVQVPPDSSLSSAVAIAGGPTDDAKLREVVFIRLNEAGEIEQEVVDLRNLVDNYQVQDGDVVVVPKTTTGSALDFVARLLGPLNFLIRVFQ